MARRLHLLLSSICNPRGDALYAYGVFTDRTRSPRHAEVRAAALSVGSLQDSGLRGLPLWRCLGNH
jgi:hypothetical protein